MKEKSSKLQSYNLGNKVFQTQPIVLDGVRA